MAIPQKEEKYTCADYIHWPREERWEIIDGTPYNRKIQRGPFENSLKEYGLINNVFLFECLDPGTEEV